MRRRMAATSRQESGLARNKGMNHRQKSRRTQLEKSDHAVLAVKNYTTVCRETGYKILSIRSLPISTFTDVFRQ
jgi:hypothetical protein